MHNFLEERNAMTKKEAALALHVSADTALRELNALLKLGIIIKQGIGKATVYLLKG